MGFFDALKNSINRTIEENREYESRGLDVIPKTPEIERYCLKKVRGKMTAQFIRPCIFSLLVLIGAIAFCVMRVNQEVPLSDISPTFYAVTGGLIVGIPIISALVFYDGLGAIKRGNYELYGGYCLIRRDDERYKTVKMNGVELLVDSFGFGSTGCGCYYYILRVTKKNKRPRYFFAYTDKKAAESRTGDVYI